MYEYRNHRCRRNVFCLWILHREGRPVKATSSGISLCSLLTVAFVVLRLCKVIDWSWWWVLSPLWMPWAIAFVVMGIVGTIVVAVKVCKRIGGAK